MNDPHPSTSSLREPLLDPEIVENSNYIVSCNPRRASSVGSLGLEDVLRSWYDQQDAGAFENAQSGGDCDDDDNNNEDEGRELLPQGLHRSERSCRPWYKNPLQIMAMISNFSTSFNVVNISLVLPILKVVLKQIHPVHAEDEVSEKITEIVCDCHNA